MIVFMNHLFCVECRVKAIKSIKKGVVWQVVGCLCAVKSTISHVTASELSPVVCGGVVKQTILLYFSFYDMWRNVQLCVHFLGNLKCFPAGLAGSEKNP